MTTTIKVHVNGNYRATIIQTVEGEAAPRQPVEVNHGEEKMLWFVHGKQNTFDVSERPLTAEEIAVAADPGRVVPPHGSGPATP